MPYVPPSPSGISFVFGGTAYTPPNSGAISFVFSQGGIESAYAAGVVPLQLAVTAEGGAPVRGALSQPLPLTATVTGAAPVNGSVAVQPAFSATATFAPVGVVAIANPISVFAYKVPDVTGVGTPKVPFVVTAARSAGALFNIPLSALAAGNSGATGTAPIQLKWKPAIRGGAGRTGAAAMVLTLNVAAYSAIDVKAVAAVPMPLRVVGAGRSNVRGAVDTPMPLVASAQAEVQTMGWVQASMPIAVAADDDAVRMGTGLCRMGVAVTATAGVGAVAQGAIAQRDWLSVFGAAGIGRFGGTAFSIHGVVDADAGVGVAGRVDGAVAINCMAVGEARGAAFGSVDISLHGLVVAYGDAPRERPLRGVSSYHGVQGIISLGQHKSVSAII